MRMEEYYHDKEKLNKKISFFKTKKQLIKIHPNHDLVKAHVDKSKHNMAFFDKNKDNNDFTDWLIVTLYYALYHSALALVVHKNYTSKNHTATLLFLIRNYSISRKEAELIENLAVTKEDVEFYTNIKNQRHSASYSTQFGLTAEKVQEYKQGVIRLVSHI